MIAFLGLLLTGCDDLFDKGDAEAVYDGPDVVGFFPLQQEVSAASGSASVEIQLISSEGLATSDLSIAFSVDGASTAVAGTHYNLTTSSPVTISAGTATANVQIALVDGSVPAGEEVRLILNLEGGSGVEPSVNLAQSTTFIRP